MLSEDNFDEPEPPEDYMSLDDDDDGAITDDTSSDEEFVELDPSGRYGRYAEVLGRGSTKTVYKAYDMVDCKEVAWSKAKTNTHAEGPAEEALAIEREIILLRRLNHKGIIKLFNAWVDETSGDTNFITELCSSTLLAFRLKHKHVSRKAVKGWARQISEGLVYLHTQDPPIIHRDLKTENIFVKSSSSTTLKIGDFGSATVLNDTHHMHTLVGTPEFMAPEMFQEDYNELVDVYSFGMCMLELVTRECPYSECTSLAQIYKHVTSGKKPKALLKVEDVQTLQFINRCLLPASKRPSAKDLLDDPFLQHKEVSTNCTQSSNSMRSLRSFTRSVPGKLLFGDGNASKAASTSGNKEERINGSTRTNVKVKATDLGSKDAACIPKDASLRPGRSYQVVGTKEGENTLRLRIRIQESSRCSNIVFPFDLRSDTPKSVAEEMVRALSYPQSDMLTIADLISEELVVLASMSKEGLTEPICSKKSEDSMLKQQQMDNSLLCAASPRNTAFVEGNVSSEETAGGSEMGCCMISALVIDEKSKQIMYDNDSATLISDSSLGASLISESSKKSESAISVHLRHDALLPKSAASVLNERADSSSATRHGALHGKSSSIATHDKRLKLKNPLNFKQLPKFTWRPPSEQGIQRRQPLHVNTLA